MLRVMMALKSLANRIPHVLYLSGAVSWNDRKVREYWARELPSRVFHLGYLSDEELRVAYANADAFVYPSLHEGFGLPILEAQASGCPVLTSTLKSCPEVAGDGACYEDAESADSIADGILRIVNEPDYRRRLVMQGYDNIARFSWERCAAQYLAILRSSNPTIEP
jgi:glycosyltransferase involved in cell wall biosynthesis